MLILLSLFVQGNAACWEAFPAPPPPPADHDGHVVPLDFSAGSAYSPLKQSYLSETNILKISYRTFAMVVTRITSFFLWQSHPSLFAFSEVEKGSRKFGRNLFVHLAWPMLFQNNVFFASSFFKCRFKVPDTLPFRGVGPTVLMFQRLSNVIKRVLLDPSTQLL